ncbi:MAG: methionyl-tRNA formyltransferase [Naasia sp.]
MRIVFAGTPEAAVPGLRALIRSGHEIVAVVTRPDALLGRKRVLTPSPVARVAEEAGLLVVKAARADADLTERLAELAPDLGVVVAYGALLREPLLEIPRLGWINLHFSLLPRWRGAAPVQRALIAGDAETGASVFQLEPGMDTGPVFAELRRPIASTDTAGSLLAALAEEGAELLLEVVDDLAAGTASSSPQTGVTTAAPKLTLDDARVDAHRPRDEVSSRIRGVTPEPGAFVETDAGRLKLLETALALAVGVPAGSIVREGRSILLGTSTAPIELLRVQPAGKKAMGAADWWRGRGSDEPVLIASAIDAADVSSAADGPSAAGAGAAL